MHSFEAHNLETHNIKTRLSTLNSGNDAVLEHRMM